MKKHIIILSIISLYIVYSFSNEITVRANDALCGFSFVLNEYFDNLEDTKWKVNLLTGAKYIELEVPDNNSFKSYMSYKSITDESSDQYALQRDYAYNGDYGIRMVDDRYCIAVGTFYAEDIGRKLDIVMENGAVLKCIVGDVKNNIHTDELNQQHTVDKSVIEFIINKSKVSDEILYGGDISAVHKDFLGEIKLIRKYKKSK